MKKHLGQALQSQRHHTDICSKLAMAASLKMALAWIGLHDDICPKAQSTLFFTQYWVQQNSQYHNVKIVEVGLRGYTLVLANKMDQKQVGCGHWCLCCTAGNRWQSFACGPEMAGTNLVYIASFTSSQNTLAPSSTSGFLSQMEVEIWHSQPGHINTPLNESMQDAKLKCAFENCLCDSDHFCKELGNCMLC